LSRRGRAASSRPGYALALGLWLLAALPAGAQLLKGPSAEPAPAPSAPSAEERRATLAALRATVEAERSELAGRRTATTDTEESAALGAELEVVDRTVGVLTDYSAMLEDTVRLREQLAASAPPEAVASLGPPPYGLASLDLLHDALSAARERRQRFEHGKKLAADELAATRSDFEKREAARREAREAEGQVDPGAAPEAAVAARRRLRLAELESRRAEVRRDFLAGAAEHMELDRALAARDEETLRAARARVAASLEVAPAEIEAQLAKLDEGEAEVARDQERNQTRIAERETRLARAQRALEATTEAAPALAAEVSAYRSELLAEKQRAGILSERLGQLTASRELWRERGRVLRGELSREELRDLAAKLAQDVDESDRSLRIAQSRFLALRSDLERARGEAEKAAAEGSVTAPWKDREARSFSDAADALERGVKSLMGLRLLQQRASDDVAERVEGRGLLGAVVSVGEAAEAVWDQELTAVDDQPITVGKLVVALAMLLLGWGAARLLSRLVGRVVRRRSRAADGAVKAIESLVFYALLALFFLLALRSVNIPLTAFTLLGGALAVGIGFGSQNILNNFISGLILLTERPIQIGDVVEIDGTQGQVERIGPRSTRIKTFESIHLIVPNSIFLEKTVINLTLSEDLVRGMIEVGVAYGSDSRKVEALIRQAMVEHALVLEEPTPLVQLAAFGDSALGFRAMFWIRDVLQRGGVASDVRFRILELFREAGIVMAFPQRDVHVDAPAPLAVRIVGDARQGEG
jgi:small-conductance mechanosensitive channel